MDLKMVDFAKGVFQIDERSVRCQSEELNKPCLMTFYGLPSEIKNKTSRNI